MVGTSVVCYDYSSLALQNCDKGKAWLEALIGGLLLIMDDKGQEEWTRNGKLQSQNFKKYIWKIRQDAREQMEVLESGPDNNNGLIGGLLSSAKPSIPNPLEMYPESNQILEKDIIAPLPPAFTFDTAYIPNTNELRPKRLVQLTR
jgi:hypothetical protein